jgi:hypothetical protein
VNNEEQLSVLNRHQALAVGTHQDQVKVGSVNTIRLTKIKLAEDGLGAKVTLLLDDLKIQNVSIFRDEAGTAQFSLPGISFRVMTYRAWFLPENVEAAIRQLADQVLPPAKPLGRDPGTGKIITAQNPASDRFRPEDFAKAVDRISNGSFLKVLI